MVSISQLYKTNQSSVSLQSCLETTRQTREKCFQKATSVSSPLLCVFRLILSLKTERVKEREMAYTFNQKRIPEFLIVYLPEHSSESLFIPNAFVTLCTRLMPKNAVLSNHMGSLWHVIVDYIDGRVYFLNGWKKFVKDNSIESGDRLIFRYNGQCGFSVKVFGQDACEKIENKANGTSKMNKVKLEDDEEEKQKEEETKANDSDNEDCDDHDSNDNDDSDYFDYIGEQEEEDSYVNKVKLGKDMEKEKDEETKENDNDNEDCDDHDCDDSDYEDFIGEQEKEEDSYMNKVKLEKGEVEKEKDKETKENDIEDKDCDDHGSNDSDYKDYIGEQEEEDSTKEEEALKNSRVGKQRVGNIGGSKKKAAVKVEPGFKRINPINIDEEEEESTTRKSKARKQSCGNNGVFEIMPVHKIGRGYKRTNDVSLEEVDIPKIILPQNPHFITKLKVGSNRNLLLVPANVLKLYQLKLQNLIFFRNKRGMHWPGDVMNPRNNQIYIRGWNDFCMANHVSMDDLCICEFAQGDNQEVNVIDVHIVCNTGEGTSRKQRALNKNG